MVADFTEASKDLPKVPQIYSELSLYPILAPRIRERMRRELFAKGIISVEQFEKEVHERALASQRREGIIDPLSEEPFEIWRMRLERVRDNLTDFYFAYNIPHTRLEELVQEVIKKRSPGQDVLLSFNPELAPWDMLFQQGEAYEAMSPEERATVEHHLQEIKVVLIKSMISDQLSFIGVAKDVFTITDLKQVRARRIGRGKIGGKAAGMLLAWKLLHQIGTKDGVDFREQVVIPESYFVGADVFYDFLAFNGLFSFMNQKYKPLEEIEADYPKIVEQYAEARFPENIADQLRELLKQLGNIPIIVRSSSLLEDNFGTSFAGKYDSFFCPNQGTLKENLTALTQSIIRVYASILRPDAIFYRRHKKLLDYDERMAILIQPVQGDKYKQYFLPTLAGVGFSHNPFRWSPQIDAEMGLLRLVWGMGTRAVDRVANDYPRMIALSHPQLRPEKDESKIRKYSQRFVDVVDLKNNRFKSLAISDVLDWDYPALSLIAAISKGDYHQPLISLDSSINPRDLILTFDNLVKNKNFVELMRAVLGTLEEQYQCPVDIEYTVVAEREYPSYNFQLHLLQCRPLSSREQAKEQRIPNVSDEVKVFTANKLVPMGYIPAVDYIILVDPATYYSIPDPTTKLEIARVVGRLNKRLEKYCFIMMGPGRWGSSNIDLGVKVTYADIYNTRMLAEIALTKCDAHGIGSDMTEVSYGTHFFQDLVEAQIYPLPLYPDDPEVIFNREFLYETSNMLADLLPEDTDYAKYVRVIDVFTASDGRVLDIVMDGTSERALAYLKKAR